MGKDEQHDNVRSPAAIAAGEQHKVWIEVIALHRIGAIMRSRRYAREEKRRKTTPCRAYRIVSGAWGALRMWIENIY
jgi:hypothetical protein